MCPKTWGSAELLLDKEVHVSCEPVFFGRRSSSKGWKVAFPTVVHILRCQSCFALMWKEQTQTEGERSERPRRPAVAAQLRDGEEPVQVWKAGGKTGKERGQLRLLISSWPYLPHEFVVFVRSFTLLIYMASLKGKRREGYLLC